MTNILIIDGKIYTRNDDDNFIVSDKFQIVDGPASSPDVFPEVPFTISGWFNQPDAMQDVSTGKWYRILHNVQGAL